MAKAEVQEADCQFAPIFRAEVARRQLRQDEIARLLNVHQPTVSYWANGQRDPSIRQLCALADLFGVSTDYLLGRTP